MEGGTELIARLTQGEIDVAGLISFANRPECGGISVFLGTTRDNFNGKKVRRLEYEAYEEMATRQLREIAEELARKWKLRAIGLVHRLGNVPVGEVSIIIVSASEHRDGAISATAEMIEKVKEKVTIWKREVYEDDTQEWKANKEWLYSTGSSSN